MMKAIVLQDEPGKASLVTDRPLPELRPGYIGVAVKAVALNPTDWKHIAEPSLHTSGCGSGCDYAGVVTRLGEGGSYDKPWKVGDRICGFVHGANVLQPADGAFAEHIIVKADVQMRIPAAMSFVDAATLGVGVITCGQGLFQQMGLDLDGANRTGGHDATVLIYGGSTATGLLGLQFVKIAGYRPVAICSPRNFDLVKASGAVAAFDYKDPQCVDRIQDAFPHIPYVWDTVGDPAGIALCAQVIAPGGVFGSILGARLARDDVKNTSSLGYTAIGEPVVKGTRRFADTSSDFVFMKQTWIPFAEKLLQDGRLTTAPVELGHGLENVLAGLSRLREGKVSGQKLVYELD